MKKRKLDVSLEGKKILHLDIPIGLLNPLLETLILWKVEYWQFYITNGGSIVTSQSCSEGKRFVRCEFDKHLARAVHFEREDQLYCLNAQDLLTRTTNFTTRLTIQMYESNNVYYSVALDGHGCDAPNFHRFSKISMFYQNYGHIEKMDDLENKYASEKCEVLSTDLERVLSSYSSFHISDEKNNQWLLLEITSNNLQFVELGAGIKCSIPYRSFDNQDSKFFHSGFRLPYVITLLPLLHYNKHVVICFTNIFKIHLEIPNPESKFYDELMILPKSLMNIIIEYNSTPNFIWAMTL